MQQRNAKHTQASSSFGDRARAAVGRAQAAHDKAFDQRFGGNRNGGKRPRKPKRTNPMKRAINDWCNRLLGVASERSFDQEEEYESHRTTRDYICNTIGTGAWGMVFPVLTIVVTQLCGAEQAGMFSMAFIIGTLLMILGNYGVRTYQVSDIEERHSFSDYQVNRVVTCILMMVVAYVYCGIRGYSEQMFTMCMGVCAYKMIDALADVYEGRLQQADKLYLAGVSQAFRSLVVLVVFSVFLLISRDLGLSSIAMAVAAIVTFVLLTFPLSLLETPKSARMSAQSIAALFKQCFPVFIALFMYALIDNIFLMAWIGIPIMSFMYGVDFEQFRGLSYIMIAAGGVTAIIDFLYQVITVLRRQKSVMKLYLITFGFSLFVPILLIDFTGLPGAVIGYLIVMTILLVLLVWEYISICIDLAKNPVDCGQAAQAQEPVVEIEATLVGEAPTGGAHARGRRPGTAGKQNNLQKGVDGTGPHT